MKVYAQETDISSLCAFSVKKVVEVYNNYLSYEEVKNLEDILLKAKEDVNKYSYIDDMIGRSDYCKKRDQAFHSINSSESLLLDIKSKTFFNSWYEGLLKAVFDEARTNKKHILRDEIVENGSCFIEGKIHGAKNKLSTSLNKEVVRRVLNELLTESKTKEETLSYMKCFDIDDQKGEMNYKRVFHRIVSRANELIEEDSISDAIKADLEHIIKNIHPSLLQVAEQKILNEIAEKAAEFRERDSKKKDMELLAVLNGGEFKDSSSLPTDLGFLEIERLYKDMLSLDIEEIDQSRSWVESEKQLRTLFEKLPVLTLEEIREAFPSSVTDKVLGEMQKTLGAYFGEVKEAKKKIVDKVFGKEVNREKLYDLEKELEFDWWQILFYPLCYRDYNKTKKFVEFQNFIKESVDVQKGPSFREELEKQLEKLDKPKREALKRKLLSEIEDEFQKLADVLGCFDHKLKNEEKQAKLLSLASWSGYKAERESLDKCIETLQKSVAVGDDTLFYRAIEDIKNNSKRMWVLQVNSELFKNICKTEHDKKDKMLSFKDLAEGFIKRRKEYIQECELKYEVEKATEEQQRSLLVLGEKNMEDQVEKHGLRTEVEEEKKAKEEAEVKAEEERKAKEEERKAKEEAEAKAKTFASLLLQIKNGKLPITALDSIDLEQVAGTSWTK